ncbi:MAG: hypothetical protein NXH96_10570 [Alteromonadaceae bacterium]|nr:hypothetical protein [Alteromonadaceae bacterium]
MLNNIKFIGIYKLAGDSILTGRDRHELCPSQLIGFCPFFLELTWYVLVDTLRKQRGCTCHDKLPDDLGDGIISKAEFISIFPDSLNPHGAQVIVENEYDGWPTLAKFVRYDLSCMSDNWQTIRTTISVIKLADRFQFYAREQFAQLGLRYFDVAAGYFSGGRESPVRKSQS